MNTQQSSFINQLVAEMEFRKYSPCSVKNYSVLMAKLEQHLQVSIEQITTEEFKSYLLRRITEDNISVSLINQHISAYKIMQVDVFHRQWEHFHIKRPRREKKLPVVLSQDEISRLIRATNNVKHKALLMLTYSAGLRRQELMLIKPSAIDSARMQVHVVQGKGRKDRYTILSQKALELLRIYYKMHRPQQYLFEPSGKKGQPLSDRTLNSIVKKCAKKAGITKAVSFHTLRHCFATHLLEQGVNLKLIQQFMGHVSLKTTSVYLHLANISPSSVTSPLDMMNV